MQHGIFHYTGAEVVPPLLVMGTDRFTAEDGETAAQNLSDRLHAMMIDEPSPYRTFNGGDYDDNLVLRPQVKPGLTFTRLS